ncbi:MAG: nuclear transport factor 2 family protein [Dehalococcoidia bacterium]
MTQQGQGTDRPAKDQEAPTDVTLPAVRRFLEAFNQQDIGAVMDMMTDDCVWESAFPLPDGTRYAGQDAVRTYLQQVFRASPDAVSEPEEMIAAGDRCIVRLVRRWTDAEDNPQHFRGMGAFRLRDGKVSEYLVYHKRDRPARTQDAAAETLAAVQSFCELFNRHDLDAVMAIMADDCLMEGLTPFPEGARYEGKATIRNRWEEVFQAYPDLRYESEEMLAVGDRCILRWVARRTSPDGAAEHYRGVDLFRVRDGKIAEKLVYTKR